MFVQDVCGYEGGPESFGQGAVNIVSRADTFSRGWTLTFDSFDTHLSPFTTPSDLIYYVSYINYIYTL